VLERLRAGRIVSCYKLNLSDVRVAEVAALFGFDSLWVDLEHIGNDWSSIEKQIYAAKVYDVDVLVRVERGSYSDYVRPLELDAAGIMVPHLMSAAEARQVVRTTRFMPLGRRPLDGGNADGKYCNLSAPEYVRQANRERFVIVQIEDPEPLDELEEICAVEGIDMIFFGPGDFSHAIGAVGEINHPRVVEARRRVAEVACRHGKFAGTVAGPDRLTEYVEMGYRFFGVGADVLALNQQCRQLAEAFRGKAAELNLG